MPQYAPPPEDLSHLNPIQRYLQKGQLDRQDWYRLGAFVLAYFILRPYIQQGAKWLFAPKEGEQQQKAYQQRRAKAKIGANAIRGTETDELADLDESEDDTAVTTGSHMQHVTEAVTRRSQKPSKAEQEKLLNWDDEPVQKTVGNDRVDVMEWVNKWDK